MPIRLLPKNTTGTVVPLRVRSLPKSEGYPVGSLEASEAFREEFCATADAAMTEAAYDPVLREDWTMAGDWEPRSYWAYVENKREYARLWWEPEQYVLQAFGFVYRRPTTTRKKPSMRPLDVTQWAAQCVTDAYRRHQQQLARRRAQHAVRRQK